MCTLYSDIKFLFKSATVNTHVGVKEGTATNYLLVDRMIKMINESSDNDDYLGRLHALVLMDDTILLATIRERLEKKFNIVQEFCKEYGMKVNLKKTKFMVINDDLHDKSDIISRSVNCSACI